MPLPHIARWTDWSGVGLEHAQLVNGPAHIEVRSAVISGPPSEGFAVLYSLKLTSDWRVLEVQASVLGSGHSVHLLQKNRASWFDVNASSLLELNGAIDVDLPITPLTNTLPVRRLNLGIGQSQQILAAYISFPDLVISADPQRYTRISVNQYRYESLDSDFVREITVDEHGLVTEYPGLFRRVA